MLSCTIYFRCYWINGDINYVNQCSIITEIRMYQCSIITEIRMYQCSIIIEIRMCLLHTYFFLLDLFILKKDFNSKMPLCWIKLMIHFTKMELKSKLVNIKIETIKDLSNRPPTLNVGKRRWMYFWKKYWKICKKLTASLVKKIRW